MKKLFIIVIVLVSAHTGKAQLASEKPLSQVYTPMMKQKLDQPKKATNDKVLPSEKKTLPKAAETSKKKSAGKQPDQNDAAKLPSNKKTTGKVIMKVRKPVD